MNFSPSTIALLVYGVIAIIGGIIGFTKSQSKASIISGSISGAGLLIAGAAAAQNQEWGKILASNQNQKIYASRTNDPWRGRNPRISNTSKLIYRSFQL